MKSTGASSRCAKRSNAPIPCSTARALAFVGPHSNKKLQGSRLCLQRQVLSARHHARSFARSPRKAPQLDASAPTSIFLTDGNMARQASLILPYKSDRIPGVLYVSNKCRMPPRAIPPWRQRTLQCPWEAPLLIQKRIQPPERPGHQQACRAIQPKDCIFRFRIYSRQTCQHPLDLPQTPGTCPSVREFEQR